MIKELGHPMFAETLPISGAQLECLTNLIRGWTIRGQHRLDISPYRVVVFRVGTNKVGDAIRIFATSSSTY